MQIRAMVGGDGCQLVVRGHVAGEGLSSVLEKGRDLLDAEGGELVLDMRSASVDGSLFVGTISRLALEARAHAKTLVVRANGRVADWLVWAGLHRVARLDVSSCAPVAG
jgi:hypothetical protein